MVKDQVQALVKRNPGPFPDECEESEAALRLIEVGSVDGEPDFAPLRPGGRREPLAYDPKGFFVITVDRAAGDLVVRHYLPDHSRGTSCAAARGRRSCSAWCRRT